MTSKFFSDAKDANFIGDITNVAGNYNAWGSSSEDHIAALLQASSRDAMHDASWDNDILPTAHIRAQQTIMEEFNLWKKKPSDRNVLWLYGPPGSSKTFVARILIQAFHHGSENRLAAAFFFDGRSDDPMRHSTKSFVPTIAYQLTTCDRHLRECIVGVIRSNPAILTAALDTQWTKLVVEPLEATRVLYRGLILVDGLCHCKNPSDQRDILNLIASSGPSFPLAFLIVSRPSPHILAAFKTPKLLALCRKQIILDNTLADVVAGYLSRAREFAQDRPGVADSVPVLPHDIINRLIGEVLQHCVDPLQESYRGREPLLRKPSRQDLQRQSEENARLVERIEAANQEVERLREEIAMERMRNEQLGALERKLRDEIEESRSVNKQQLTEIAKLKVDRESSAMKSQQEQWGLEKMTSHIQRPGATNNGWKQSMEEGRHARETIQQGIKDSLPRPNLACPQLLRINSDLTVPYWGNIKVPTCGLERSESGDCLNALVQCLNATAPFTRFFLDAYGWWKTSVNNMALPRSKDVLARTFATLLHELRSAKSTVLSLTDFKQAISRKSGKIWKHADNVIISLITLFHSELSRNTIKPPCTLTPESQEETGGLPAQLGSEREWMRWKTMNDSIIVNLFYGQFRTCFECPACQKASTTYDAFFTPELTLYKNHFGGTLMDLLSDMFGGTEVKMSSKCTYCKTERTLSRQRLLARLPPILILRIRNPPQADYKAVVRFPMTALNLTVFMPAQAQTACQLAGISDDPQTQSPPYLYDLYAVMKELQPGRFAACIQSENEWLYCSDTVTKPMDPKELADESVRILFYKRVKADGQ